MSLSPKPGIKSFVRRAGRMSPRQRQGLDQWLPQYEVKLGPEPWDYSAIFGRQAEVILEIGFGMGQSLLAMAIAQPEIDFIGVEVHRSGIGSLAADLHDNALTNLRIAALDAVELLQKGIPAASLCGIQILFPDPWPKARHHKRRLIQPSFVSLLVNALKPQGFLHIATDWTPYAEHIAEVLSQEPRLSNQADLSGLKPAGYLRPLTKFEKRGLKLGHSIHDFEFISVN